MKDYQYYFFDLDGTLLSGEHLLPYAQELIEELYHRNKNVFFLTNHPVRSRAILEEDLNRMGLVLNKEQLLTPVIALEEYLTKEVRQHCSLYVVGSPMIAEELQQMGYHVMRSHTDKSKATIYVVLGMSSSITYCQLQKGFHLLQQGASLIMLNRDLLCPNPEGFLLDTGSLARVLDHPKLLKHSEVVGKPSKWMQKAILKKNEGNLMTSVIVGDSLSSDIAIGQVMGVDTFLVYSGVTTEEDLISANIRPSQAFESIKDIYLRIKEQSYV